MRFAATFLAVRGVNRKAATPESLFGSEDDMTCSLFIYNTNITKYIEDVSEHPSFNRNNMQYWGLQALFLPCDIRQHRLLLAQCAWEVVGGTWLVSIQYND
jgi:hypothetical protein